MAFREHKLPRIDQKKDFSRPLTFTNDQINMIKFFPRTDNSKKGWKTNSGLYIPEHMLLRSAEVQKLLSRLSIKGDFITSKKGKNFLSSRIDAKYHSFNLIKTR